MRYQEVASRLIIAANGAGLKSYATRDQVELQQLDRSFRTCVVPDVWEPPFDIRAQLEFYWPCEQTAHSIYGPEGVCALYHDPDEECIHYEFDAQTMIELSIEYHLPDHVVRALKTADDMKHFAQRIHEAHRECVDHENLVFVCFESVFYRDNLRISSALAGHHWVIEGEDLEDEGILNSILTGISGEVRGFLLRLADLFAEPEEEKGRRMRRRKRSRKR